MNDWMHCLVSLYDKFFLRSTLSLGHIDYKHFKNLDELYDYAGSNSYGREGGTRRLCVALNLEKKADNKFVGSLHYTDLIMTGDNPDVPPGMSKPFDEFQQGPDMERFTIYKRNFSIPYLA